jgi:hypothetical protein
MAKMTRMSLCATATVAAEEPILALSRLYVDWKTLFFLFEALLAAWQSVVLRWGFPLRVVLLRVLPALSLLPGQRPAQAAACAAEPKTVVSAPSSPRMTCAVVAQMPGIDSSRA